MYRIGRSVLVILATSLVWRLPFFMDNILTSTICRYYVDQGFGHLILPTLIDAGHPPLFYLYLATAWKIFGVSLAVAHLAMVPFMFLFLWSCRELLPKTLPEIFVFPLSIGPVLAQFTMPSYDFAMLSMALAAIVFIGNGNRVAFFVLLILISLISLRGIMISGCMAIAYGYKYSKYDKNYLYLSLISSLPLLCWYGYHYSMTGWLLSSPSSHWHSQRVVSLVSFLIPNFVGFVRCFIDNGMMILTIIYLFFIIKNKKYKEFLFLSVLTFMLVMPLFFTSNPILQRYFLFIYVLMALSVAEQLADIYYGKYLIAILSALLLLSNLFYYKDFSNSWDTNGLYWRYFSGYSAVIQYLDSHKIAKYECAASFPVFNSQRQVYAHGDTIRMQDALEIPTGTTEYLIYSNACNAFEKSDLQLVRHDYVLVKSYASYPFYFDIYKRMSMN